MQGNSGDTDIENRLTDMVGGRKKRVGRLERLTWKHTSPCVKEIANGNLLDVSGNSNQGSLTSICFSMTSTCKREDKEKTQQTSDMHNS